MISHHRVPVAVGVSLLVALAALVLMVSPWRPSDQPSVVLVSPSPTPMVVITTPATGLVTHENPILGYRIGLPNMYRRALSVEEGRNVGVDVYTPRTETEDRELCRREQGSGLQSPERAADLRLAVHANVAGGSAVDFATAQNRKIAFTSVESITINGREAAKVVHQPSGDTAYYVIRANDRLYELTPLLLSTPATQPKGWLDQIAASFRAIPLQAPSIPPASGTTLCGN